MLSRHKGNKNSRFPSTIRIYFRPPAKITGPPCPPHRVTPQSNPPPPPLVCSGFRIVLFSALRICAFRIVFLSLQPSSGGLPPVRAHSSVGQSSGLIIRRSWDHAPLGPLRQKEVASICSLFSFAPPQNVQQNLQQKRSPNILQPLFPLQSFGTLKFGFYYCKFRPSDSRSISRFAACRNI